MNKSYKVVFSKARGALMVVNEITSSVQAKGTKTVVAAVAAALMTSAWAADAVASSSGELVTPSMQLTTPNGTEDATNAALVVRPESAKTIYFNNVKFGDKASVDGAVASYMAASAGKNQFRLIGGKFSNFDVALGEVGLGGSIFEAVAYENNLSVFVEGVTFEDNHSTNRGGVGYISGVEDFAILNSSHIGNTVDTYGGAYAVMNGSKGQIKDSEFLNNAAKTNGGALRISNSEVEFAGNTVFLENTAGVVGTDDTQAIRGHGGALYIDGTSKVTGSARFDGNSAVGNGGAVEIASGTVELKDSVFSGNNAGLGGAVDVQSGTASFTDTLFSNNEARGFGGAVRLNGASAKFAVTEGQDLIYSGNKSGTNQADASVKNYNGNTGDFLYISGNGALAEFDVAENAKLTIADSIASYGDGVKLEKSGAGDLVITGSMEGYEGDIEVAAGSLMMKTGFGSISNHAQARANSGSGEANEGSALTVAAEASATLEGKLTVNNAVEIANSGTTTLADVELVKKTYTDLTEPEATPRTIETVGTLTIDNDGELYIKGSVVKAEGTTLTVDNAGTIYTTFDNLAKATISGEETTWAKVADTFSNTGLIIETGYTGDYTLGQLKSIQDGADGGLNLGKFAFANANLVADAEEGGEVAFTAITGEGGVSFLQTKSTVTAEVDAEEETAAVTMVDGKTITVGAIRAEGAETLTVDGQNGDLTIGGGDSEELFLGVADSVKLKGTLTLGIAGTSNTVSQKVEIGAVADAARVASTNGLVTVANTQTWMDGAAVASGSNLTIADTGALTVENGLDNQGTVQVGGSLDVDYVAANCVGSFELNGGSMGILGNAPKAAKDAVEDEAAFAGALDLVNISLSWQGGNAVGLGVTSAQAEAAAASYFGEDASSKNVYFVGKQLDLNGGSLGMGDNYALIVDVAGVAATDGFSAEHGVMSGALNKGQNGNDGLVVLKNLTGSALTTNEAGTKILKLASGGTSTATVDYGTIFYGAAKDADKTDVYGADLTLVDGKATSLTTTGTVTEGTISFTPNADALAVVEGTYLGKAVEDAVYNVQFGQNELVDKIVFGLDDAYVAAYNEAVAAGIENASAYAENKVEAQISGAEEAAIMGVTGGAFNVAIDVNNEVAKSLDRRMSVANGVVRADQGINAWVDVIGTTNEAKRLFGGGMGYEADLYGAVLGADWTASCGAILGAAVAVGSGDANSVGQTGSQIDNDVDYYGVSIYGSHQVGSVNGKFDIGYVATSNELSTTVFGQSVKEDLDADVFTIGLGAEYLAKAGSVNVVPHAGIRWSKIDMDDSKFGAEYDAMNLFQMPIGVTFSGAFETAGWTFAPMVDLSVVPAFGDKDADFSVAGVEDHVRVVDTNPIQATLGLSATTGDWTFGVNYGLTAGGDDRMNNAFNATARYTF